MGPSEPGDRGSARRFDVFLSYNSRDGAAVERIAQRLREAGVEPWLDRWALTAGGEWQRELAEGLDAAGACAVFVGGSDLGAWELQEVAVALDRAATMPGFRVFPVLLPGVQEPFDPNRLPRFLRTRTWVDLRRAGDDDGLRRLVKAVNGVAPGPTAVAASGGVAPYRGLQAFDEHDAALFFGRSGEVQRLLEKLKSSRFLAVVGPSGSGKSSLVRAGLLPELRANGGVVILRPGAAPLTALAAKLSDLRPGQAMQATIDELARDERTLHLCVALALASRPDEERLVVVVDQLEEIFTLCRDEAERRSLFSVLLYAASTPGGRAVVIVTMRDDFYGRCAAYPELAQLVASQQLLVGPMSHAGLRDAIEGPARCVGLRLEDGLSDTILADIAVEPGALPLLEHALLELWERRRGNTLTLDGYRESGGVYGALAQRAEEIYGAFTPEQQAIARRVLLRLTQPGEGTEDTRRRATRSELAPVEADAAVDVVVARLVEARLLTTGRDEAGCDIVDVSHEALIRGWPRLRSWIEADRAGLLTQRRLTDVAREWDALEREAGALYRGARLTTAREWASGHESDMSALEREFLTASEDAERRRDEARRQGERRRLRVLRASVGALLVVAAVVTTLAIWALHQGARARTQASKAMSLALTSRATALLTDRPDLSLLLGLAGYEEAPRADARDSLVSTLTAIRRAGPVVGILHGHANEVESIAFSADGRLLASGGDDGTVRLWDARTHRSLGVPMRGTGAPVFSVAFNPDGHSLASAGGDGTLRIWDVRSHRQLGVPLRGHTDDVNSVKYSPDGLTLASGDDDHTVRLWDARTHLPLGSPLRGHTDAVEVVAFSADGRTLASAGDDRTIRLWDARSHRPLGAPLRGQSGAVYGLDFSPGGRVLVSSSTDRTVRFWDTRTHHAVGGPLRGDTDAIWAVEFSPDGRRLATSGNDRTVRLWDARTRKPLGSPLRGHSGPVYDVDFSPDGRVLASASTDRTVRLWDLREREPRNGTLRGHTGPVNNVVFGPDGHTLASTSDDRTVRLWDTRTHKPVGSPLRGHTAPTRGAAFSRNGRRLASTSDDATVRLWDPRTREPLGPPLRGHAGTVLDVAFSPDGHTLASSGSDRTVRLWDTRTSLALGPPLRGHTGPVEALAFSPDGHTLASSGEDRTVRLWDTRTHEPTGAPMRGHIAAVYAVAFSPDGRTLVSGGEDQTVRLWDARSRRPIGSPMHGHTGGVDGLAFSPDGHTLASSGEDETVRLWDVRTRRPLGSPLRGHTGAVYAVAFSPDGHLLASASTDRTVRLWDQTLWRSAVGLRAAVCGFVGGGLTRSEWALDASGIPYRAICSSP